MSEFTELPQGTVDDYERQQAQVLAEKMKSSADHANLSLTQENILQSPITQDEAANNIDIDVTKGAATKVAAASDYSKFLSPSFRNLLGGDPSVLTRQQLFPTVDQPIRVGQSQGKVIGSVPIFAAPAPLVPLGIIQQRDKQLAKAASARKKLVDKALKLSDVDTVPQFQRQMNGLRKDMIDKWAKKTNNHFEVLMDMNSPLAREFHEDMRQLKLLDDVVTDGDVTAEAMITAAKQGTVPNFVIEHAMKIREGAFDLKELTTKKGMADFSKNLTKLYEYQNTTKVLDTAVKNMQADILPDLQKSIDEVKDIGARKELYSLYEQRNIGNNRLQFIKAMRSHIGDDRIRGVVEKLYEDNNLWVGGDKQKAIESGIDYMSNMIGEEIKLEQNYVNLNSGSSISIGGDDKRENPFYVNKVDQYNENKTTKPVSRYAKFSYGTPVQKSAARQTWSADMGFKLDDDGSGEYKAIVPTTKGNNYTDLNLKGNVLLYKDIHLDAPKGWTGHKYLTADRWLDAVNKLTTQGEEISEENKNMFELLTKEKYNKQQGRLYGDVFGLPTRTISQHWTLTSSNDKADQSSNFKGGQQIVNDEMMDQQVASATTESEKETLATTLLSTATPNVMVKLNAGDMIKTKPPTEKQGSATLSSSQIREKAKENLKLKFHKESDDDWNDELRREVSRVKEEAEATEVSGAQQFVSVEGFEPRVGIGNMYLLHDMSIDGAAQSLDAKFSKISTQQRASDPNRASQSIKATPSIPSIKITIPE